MKPFRFAYLLFNPAEILFAERDTVGPRFGLYVSLRNGDRVLVRATNEVGAEQMLQEFHNLWLIALGFPPNQ